MGATQLLEAASAGDANAAGALLPLVYDELRRLAARKLAGEKPGQTLDATGLVHEAYLRLLGPQGQSQPFSNRRHFFAASAQAMRHILVESARRKGSVKRGGHGRADFDLALLPAPELAEELLAVHEAVDGLAATDPQAAELVGLRYFAGLSIPEAAEVLGIGPRSADRLWAFARAWLRREIAGTEPAK